MKTFIIRISSNEDSVRSVKQTIQSAKDVGYKEPIEIFEAIKPNEWKSILPYENTFHNYARPDNVGACFASHYLLWKECIKLNEPILILEHDAIFTERLDPIYIINSNFNAVGINNPLGATRESRLFHTMVESQKDKPIIITPTIDEISIPQGLAGHSAYILSPGGAKMVLDAAHIHGLWPNDALMCKQIIPRLGVTTKYYTKVQGTPSTTTK